MEKNTNRLVIGEKEELLLDGVPLKNVSAYELKHSAGKMAELTVTLTVNVNQSLTSSARRTGAAYPPIYNKRAQDVYPACRAEGMGTWRKKMEKFDFEVIAEGSFEDAGYIIRTIVIRLNPAAMNEYIMSINMNCHECYETEEEWENHKVQKTAARRAWERKILDLLKFTGDTGYLIAKAVSEIFTVVLFENTSTVK